jgi:hypothetical protein
MGKNEAVSNRHSQRPVLGLVGLSYRFEEQIEPCSGAVCIPPEDRESVQQLSQNVKIAASDPGDARGPR